MGPFRGTCPKGHQITAIIQLIIAETKIANFARNKTPIYTRDTKVFHSTSKTFAAMRDGMMIVADDNPAARYRCGGNCGDITYNQISFSKID